MATIKRRGLAAKKFLLGGNYDVARNKQYEYIYDRQKDGEGGNVPSDAQLAMYDI